MKKKDTVRLSERQIAEIKALAAETRSLFGVSPFVPVGNDIYMVLEKKGIFLCEYPFSESEDTHTQASIVIFKAGEETITFIGLNTACYYDEQIFALAHEIYHYTTKTGAVYSSDAGKEDEETEKKADRFAAEFLLPADSLKTLIGQTFNASNLADVPETRLLRFIAKLQCDWWLPYHAVINRLFEEQYISGEQYESLFEKDCRSEESVYRRILSSTDNKIADLLNTKTRTVGVSSKIIDVVINNYEDGYIDDDEFVRVLELLGKHPDDYGIQLFADSNQDFMEAAESEGNGCE